MSARLVEFSLARAAVNLRELIASDLGPANSCGMWSCPFHDGDRTPSLGVTPAGGHFRCFGCGRRGDAIQWVADRRGVSLPAAAAILIDGTPSASHSTPEHPRQLRIAPGTTPPPAWQDTAWQTEVDRLVLDAERDLWGPDGRRALDYLRYVRGLKDHSIRRFRLGYVAAPRTTNPLAVLGGKPISVARGVLVPWLRPGSWYATTDDADGDPGSRWVGAEVRRLTPDGAGAGNPKYLVLGGSEQGHLYPFIDLAPHVPTLLCEGRFDAMLAWQEVGHVLNVATLGGVMQGPLPESHAALAACPFLLVAFDHDANFQGDIGFFKLADETFPGRCRRFEFFSSGVRPKDITEFVTGGHDLARHLKSEYARLGWTWPFPLPPWKDRP